MMIRTGRKIRALRDPRVRLSGLGRVSVAASLAAALLAPLPASAQFSESYRFLDSVRKKEGDKVEEMLSVPGSQIVNTRDITTGQSALHIVTQRRDLVWMQYLIAKGANVNVRDNKGVTPIDTAVTLGFAEGVELLISVGARVDEPSNTGETPLIDAVNRRDIEVVRLLLKAGANPDRPDNSGRSARDYATLESKDNPILAEIEATTRARSANGPRKTYGPTF